MVIPYYCEDYPENPDNFQTDNDAASSLHPKTSPNDAASRLEPTPAEIFAWNSDDDGNAVIVELRDKTARSVVVPETLEGLPVVAIGERVFQNAENLTQLVLPTSLKCIGAAAFANCAALTRVEFPQTLEQIEKQAFYDCAALTEIVFHDVDLPELTVNKYVSELVNIDFHYYQQIIDALRCKTQPSNIAKRPLKIDGYAFYNCSSLTRIRLPNAVSQLGPQVFGGCSSVFEFAVSPQNLFFRTLDGVLFSRDLKVLVAYPPAKSNERYKAPSSVKTVLAGAFSNSDALREVVVNNIQDRVFNQSIRYCRPSPAFVNCPNLAAIRVAPKNPRYRDDDGVLLTRDGATLLRCPEGKTGKYVVPEGVEYISWNAFYNCSKLTEILLPSTLKRIGEDAFAGCSSLSQIVLPNGLEEVSQYAFAGCASLTQVVVPSSVKILDENAFANCPRLEPPELPDGVFYSHIIYD